MTVRIIFQSNSVPVVYHGVEDVYTKPGLLCLSYDGGVIKFPLCNIFSIESDYNWKDEGVEV